MKVFLNWILGLISLAVILFDKSFQAEFINLSIAVFNGLNLKFSLSHFISIIALIALLSFIYYKTWNEIPRIKNSLLHEKSFFIRFSILIIVLGFFGLIVYLIFNFDKTPELFIIVVIYYVLMLFEFLAKKFNNAELKDSLEVQNGKIITPESSINKFSLLDTDQRRIVEILYLIIANTAKEYISIALNGNWGSGKTSITNGLKDKYEKFEYIEINFWNIPTPEGAVEELKNEISKFIKKAFVIIGHREISYFDSFVSQINGTIGIITNIFSRYFSTYESKSALEEKIERTLHFCKKEKLIILFDDIDRIPVQHINFFIKQIAYISELRNVVSITNISINEIESKLKVKHSDKIINDEVINFLDKIFSARINTPHNQHNIRKYAKEELKTLKSRLNATELLDKNAIIDDIEKIIDYNPNMFENYREVNQIFNDVVTYYYAFNKQKISIRKYIPTEVLFVFEFIKYEYPKFFQEIIFYIKVHSDEFPDLSGDFEVIAAKPYDLRRFVRDKLLSKEENKNEDNSKSIFQTKYLKQGLNIQKLNNLLNIAFSHGLNKKLIAQKYLTNRINDYELTPDEFELLQKNKLEPEKIKKILFANDELRDDYNIKYIETRLDSFIVQIKNNAVFYGNRLNALIALFDIYYFDEDSLKNRRGKPKAPQEISDIFTYTHGNKEELNEIDVENFNYELLFKLWTQVIELPGGSDFMSKIRGTDGSPNKLSLLFCPRYVNYFKINSVYSSNREEYSVKDIFKKEEYIINKIIEYKFDSEKKYFNHLLLLYFYKQHSLFGEIHDEFNSRDNDKLYQKFENDDTLIRLVELIAKYLFKELSQHNFYDFIDKKHIGNFSIYVFLMDLIFLNIIAKNDEFLFKLNYSNLKKLYSQAIINWNLDDLSLFTLNIAEAIRIRVENKNIDNSYLQLLKTDCPEIYTSLNDKSLSKEKIKSIIKNTKK